MASFIRASDVVAAAVEIERRGFQFYMEVCNQAVSQIDKDFFEALANEERVHEAIFSAMLQRIGGVALPAGATDQEYLDYVKDLLDSHSLFTAEAEVKAVMSPLNQAMAFEKDTLLFFIELERLVPESERHLVKQCADEERKHLRRLTEYQKTIVK